MANGNDKVFDLIEGGNKLDLFGDTVKKAPKTIVPRVDKHVGKKRWGHDTPMFDNKEDMHSFLQGVGMAPGGAWADILDAGLYMTEGDFTNMLISVGASVPILGMVARSGNQLGKYTDFFGKLNQTQRKVDMD